MDLAILAVPPADEFVRSVVPAWVIPALVVLTELGNPGFVLGLLALDYWIGEHERGAHAFAVGVAGVALLTALKALFGAPRPPASINQIPISGFSFPSGHVFSATVVYGVLAADLEVGSARARTAAATGLVAFVAFTRVALGVHYVRDVFAGVLFGLAFLGLAIAATERDPWRGFVLAVGTGLAALVVSAASHDGVAVAGAALGAAATWFVLDDIPRVDARPRRLALVGAGLPVLAGLGYVATVPPLPLAVVFVLNVALMAVVLAAPKLVVRAV